MVCSYKLGKECTDEDKVAAEKAFRDARKAKEEAE